jgi:hypothetical protein
LRLTTSSPSSASSRRSSDACWSSDWALDREGLDGLARLGDAVGDARRPVRLDADDDGRGDVRVPPGADQRAEVQLQVLAVLQPPVGVRQRQRSRHLRGGRLAGRVREVVDRQQDDVVADADGAVLAPVPLDYHRALLRLCVCT